MSLVNIDDLLILLADGPQLIEDLCLWLEEPLADVNKALRLAMKDGQVRHVGADRKWALASHVAPMARPHLASGSPLRNEQVHPIVEEGLEPDRDLVDIEDVDFIDNDDKAPGEEFDGERAGYPDTDWDAPPVKRGPGRQRKSPKPGLRQAAPYSGAMGPSWWVGLPREDHQAEGERRRIAMSQSKEARLINGNVRG